MNLDDCLKGIPVVDPGQNYWLVRTSGGKYYDEFFIKKRIGFGESYLLPSAVNTFSSDPNEFYKSITPIIKEKTETERPGIIANQFFRFYHELKKGDLILIPSAGSDRLRIGKIIDEIPEKFVFTSEDGLPSCPHIHTRQIEWITEKHRSEFNPKIISLFYSHHAIVDAKDYAQYINGALYDLFVVDSQAHLMLRVGTTRQIPARMLVSTFSKIFDITQLFEEELGKEINVDEVDIRLNINSPGTVELISSNLVTILVVGLLIVLVSGGQLKSRHIELKSDGVIKQILDFLMRKDSARLQAEIVRHALEDLNVKDPKEVLQIIQAATQKIKN